MSGPTTLCLTLLSLIFWYGQENDVDAVYECLEHINNISNSSLVRSVNG